MSKTIKRVFSIAVAAIFAIIIACSWWLFYPHEIYSASIYVESGEPFYRVVRQLKDREIVKSPWFFSKAGILIGLDHRVIPGRYDFGKRVSNFDVMRKFWHGHIAFMTLTIPEGYNLQQVSRLLNQRCGTSREVFDGLVRDSLYLAGLGVEAGFGEGYLFPETYRFEWGISADGAIRVMVEQLYSGIDRSLLARSDSMGYTFHELLTMASIIEMEGLVHDEFGTIASVYRNRYIMGMKLQADPTVIYGMGGLDRDLLVKDYQFPSEYNTYLHMGLPPTPICSPGMGAIRAALYPDSTDFLYFVADGNGRHIFNKTYSGHLKDTRRIKKESKGR
jgi:UPF0755 protein